jgi:hypothetical protein
MSKPELSKYCKPTIGDTDYRMVKKRILVPGLSENQPVNDYEYG